MIRILFICHGNICRSPMAEFVFRKKAAERGVSPLFSVSSAATSTEEIRNGVGNPVYPPAQRELKKHGITCDGKRAVQVTKADYHAYGNPKHNKTAYSTHIVPQISLIYIMQ